MFVGYSQEALKKAAEVIRSGGVIAFPTDTLFALSCDASNDAAISKIFKFKGRAETQTLPVLVDSTISAVTVADLNHDALDLAQKHWPGALTIVSKVRRGVNLSSYCSNDGSVAVRVPGNDLALSLLKECGMPLVGTSANLSGGANAKSAKEVQAIFGDAVDLIIDDGTVFNDLIPSTIVSTVNGIKVLRKGVVDI